MSSACVEGAQRAGAARAPAETAGAPPQWIASGSPFNEPEIAPAAAAPETGADAAAEAPIAPDVDAAEINAADAAGADVDAADVDAAEIEAASATLAESAARPAPVAAQAPPAPPPPSRGFSLPPAPATGPAFGAAPSARDREIARAVEEGQRALARGDNRAALRIYTATLSGGRLDPDALTGAAVAYIRLGAPENAEPLLRAAVEIEPNTLAARNNLGVLLYDMGRYLEARSEFERAWAISGGSDATIARNLGQVEIALARIGEGPAPVEAGVLAGEPADHDLVRLGHGRYRIEPKPPEAIPATGAATEEEDAS